MTNDEAVNSIFEEIVEPYTGGSPQDTGLAWTGLKPKEIQHKLEAKGFVVSYYIASELLANSNLRKRTYLKSKTLGKAASLAQ